MDRITEKIEVKVPPLTLRLRPTERGLVIQVETEDVDQFAMARIRLMRVLEETYPTLPVILTDSHNLTLPLWGKEQEKVEKEFLSLPEKEREELLLKGAGLVVGIGALKKPILPPGEGEHFARPILDWDILSALVEGRGVDLRTSSFPPKWKTLVLGVALYHANTSGRTAVVVSTQVRKIVEMAERVGWEYGTHPTIKAYPFPSHKYQKEVKQLVTILAEGGGMVEDFIKGLLAARDLLHEIGSLFQAEALGELAEEVEALSKKNPLFLVEEVEGDIVGKSVARFFPQIVV